MYKILILLTIFTLSCLGNHQLQAQPYELDELKMWQIKGYAKSSVKQGDIYSGIYFYEYLNKKYPKNKNYLWTLALLQEKSRNYAEAYRHFKNLSVLDKKKGTLAFYHMAINGMSMGKYNEAHEVLKDIKRTKKKSGLPKNFKEKVIIQLEGCEYAMSIQDSLILNKDVNKLNQTINKPHIEFNPFYISDSVFIYSSSNIDSVVYYEQNDQKPKRKFYKANIGNKNWQGGFEASSPFYNYPDFDTGDGVFSLDGNRFYFTQCKENWMHKMVCQLFVTHKEGNSWTIPKALNQQINIPNYSITQPAIGTCYDPKLEVIYFISDRPGGYGGTDIWFTIYDTQKQTYQKPINAGIYLNTTEDETTPFYDNFGHRIFFSTNGRSGLGGLDVYYAQGDMVNWNEAINIGPPINSPCDDLYYSEHELGNKGFFTSNRYGGFALTHATCCDDIYHWEKSEIEKIWVKGEIKGNQYTFNNLLSTDQSENANTVSNLDSARVNLYLKKDTSNLVFLAHQTTDKDGAFNFLVPKGFDYEIVVDDSRVLTKKLEFSTRTVHSRELNMKLKPVTLKTLDKDPIVLSNIYYEFNNDQLTQESKSILNETLLKLMKDYNDLLVEISSHTDNKGNDKYNMRLSQRRANNVVSYLVSQGIEDYRLKATGYGESKPIADNTNADGSDNPKGRALNRRTEFRLIDDSEMRK